MREQSQLDDMRAAIRGDMERAKARRESVMPAPLPDKLPPPTTEAKLVLTPARPVEVEPEPEPDVGSESLRPEVSETVLSEPHAEIPQPELPAVQEPEPHADSESLRPEVPETVLQEPQAEAPEPRHGFFSRLFGR